MPLICRIFNFESEPLPNIVNGPFLLAANHNTDLDPVLLSAATDAHMYFVASEHVLRGGIGAWLLKKLFAPIARLKGATDASAAMAILRKLRGSANVCLFAEGNRSFNGITGAVFPATGKMVKAAGCYLITYRFEGGYFTSPRWSTGLRRGVMRGRPVRVFSPAQLKSMSAAEINEAIATDIFEDAYERQAEENVAFRGKRLAEKLETALFVCPCCEKAGTMSSRGDELKCKCGMSARYDEKGYLHGAPFSTVTEWDAWQSAKLAELAKKDSVLCHDDDILLAELTPKGEKHICRGELSLSANGLRIGDVQMPLREISDMAIVGRGRIMLTSGEGHYELRGNRSFCGRKYFLFYKLLKG